MHWGKKRGIRNSILERFLRNGGSETPGAGAQGPLERKSDSRLMRCTHCGCPHRAGCITGKSSMLSCRRGKHKRSFLKMIMTAHTYTMFASQEIPLNSLLMADLHGRCLIDPFIPFHGRKQFQVFPQRQR